MMDRRTLIASGLVIGAASFAGVRITAASAPTDQRFLMVILRGAADGMSIAAPLGDPGFASARAAWRDHYARAPKLDGMFSLHPKMPNFAKMYADGDALVGHALATSYRERSHFDAQNVLESGALKAYQRSDGFLNRFLGLMPQNDFSALAIAPTVPLALRGPNKVDSYAPSKLPQASSELIGRVTGLYGPDPQLASMWQSTLKLQGIAGDDTTAAQREIGALAARMMTDKENARLVMIDLPGWDSHGGQQAQLDKALAGLDAMLGEYRKGMGQHWASTLVAVVTEFGRTVAINGTNGTDHGTAGAALLAGGAVKGKRVVTDWPGLAQSQLYEGRDLKPTNSVEAFLSGALAEHFAIDPARTFETIFPGRNQRAMSGLIG